LTISGAAPIALTRTGPVALFSHPESETAAARRAKESRRRNGMAVQYRACLGISTRARRYSTTAAPERAFYGSFTSSG
jgi:hypothetical protein